MKKNRRRSQPGDEPPAGAQLLDERQAGAEKRRRRSLPETSPTEEPEAARPEVATSRRRSLRGGEPIEVAPVAGAAREAGPIGTDAGQYLRQAARDDAPSRFGAPPGEVDESARRVWEIAFGLAVRRRFEPGTALAEISRTVASAVHEHAAAGLPILDAEMLVRKALGENVPVGDIGGDVLIAVHLLLFASLTDELALGDAELDALVAEAEENAAVRRPEPPGAP